jgi:glycosyltransferase involved in cell wall biosynthesis
MSSSANSSGQSTVETHPMVSIIMPTFNRPDSLRTALESLSRQTFKDFEAVIVNDAGQDVQDVVESFKDIFSTTLVNHESNEGGATARNTAIAVATGKYITYLDDDDTVYPDHLETLVSFLETSPQQVAYTDAIRVFQEKDGDQYVTKSREVFHSHDFHPDHILVANFMAIHCVMHERACFEVCGVFDDTLTSHQDLDLWIRMSRIFEFSHIKKVTAEFKEIEGKESITSKSAYRIENLKNIYAKYAEYASPQVQEFQRDVLEKMYHSYGVESPEEDVVPPTKNYQNRMDLSLESLRETFLNTPMPLHTCLLLRHLYGEMKNHPDTIFPATFVNVESDGSEVNDPGVSALLAGMTIGKWSMSADSLTHLVELLRREQPSSVLEFGGGISTLVIAHIMREIHGDVDRPLVFSIDQMEDAIGETKINLDKHGLGKFVKHFHAPVGRVYLEGMKTNCYQVKEDDWKDLLGDARPECVIVDGPHGGFGARFATLPMAFPYLAENAILVMDDALRDSELAILDWWQRLGYATVEGVLWLGKGMAMARRLPSAPKELDSTPVSPREILVRLAWHEFANTPNRPVNILSSPARLVG